AWFAPLRPAPPPVASTPPDITAALPAGPPALRAAAGAPLADRMARQAAKVIAVIRMNLLRWLVFGWVGYFDRQTSWTVPFWSTRWHELPELQTEALITLPPRVLHSWAVSGA